MNIEMLTAFFMWYTIINAGIFVFWLFFYKATPNLTLKTQQWLFQGLTKEEFDKTMYNFLGYFKLGILFFGAAPWIALLIIG